MSTCRLVIFTEAWHVILVQESRSGVVSCTTFGRSMFALRALSGSARSKFLKQPGKFQLSDSLLSHTIRSIVECS